jgi:hypothetical protein
MEKATSEFLEQVHSRVPAKSEKKGVDTQDKQCYKDLQRTGLSTIVWKTIYDRDKHGNINRDGTPPYRIFFQIVKAPHRGEYLRRYTPSQQEIVDLDRAEAHRKTWARENFLEDNNG